ncbi:MAG: MaoC family dehydratase [Anaeromicrobium sp.]|uniref:MaoC family dehydratase n=1 Tax=Anaeromicrobium sp. TaxID=1929132 RepID=UPI0025D34AC4|nr:MaoC family dehydratase [Anaeromicrobium sp.]MCT4593360.1 MaoC family dehydratase [Anaeromicrobium sp.]
MIKDIKYEEITIGLNDSLTKTISEDDISTFAQVSGDFNPIHLDEDFASKSIFKKKIAHGMLTSSLISSVLGTKLPGANTLYLSQTLKFLAPVYINDTITATVTVVDKREDKRLLTLETNIFKSDGTKVVSGSAVVKKM